MIGSWSCLFGKQRQHASIESGVRITVLSRGRCVVAIAPLFANQPTTVIYGTLHKADCDHATFGFHPILFQELSATVTSQIQQPRADATEPLSAAVARVMGEAQDWRRIMSLDADTSLGVYVDYEISTCIHCRATDIGVGAGLSGQARFSSIHAELHRHGDQHHSEEQSAPTAFSRGRS